MIHEVVCIGRRFYHESDTSMSFIYEVTKSGLSRLDWGLIEMACENGEEFHIRPATDEEMLWAYRKLDSIKENRRAK